MVVDEMISRILVATMSSRGVQPLRILGRVPSLLITVNPYCTNASCSALPLLSVTSESFHAQFLALKSPNITQLWSSNT